MWFCRGYTLKEMSQGLGVHYTTIIKVINSDKNCKIPRRADGNHSLMAFFSLFTQIPGFGHSEPEMLSVLKLFLLPVGGGIPAGVLLAQGKGVAWPITAALYLVSDIFLAIAFEPILQLLAWFAGKVPFLVPLSAALRAATARSAAHFSGTGAGPLTLIMVAFGVDPMTGRTTALAAGHGFLAGWAFAIAGDMLYFTVIAVTTLRLHRYFRDPNTTMLIVLGAMFVVPILVRRFRSATSVRS